MVHMAMLVKPLFLKASGAREFLPKPIYLPLAGEASNRSAGKKFTPARVVSKGGNSVVAEIPSNGSGDFISAQRAEGVFEIPAGVARLAPGDLVGFHPVWGTSSGRKDEKTVRHRGRRELGSREDDLAGAADPRVEGKRVAGGGGEARRAPVRHRPPGEGQPPAHRGGGRHDDDHLVGKAGVGEAARRLSPVDELLERYFSDMDLVLVEGFRGAPSRRSRSTERISAARSSAAASGTIPPWRQ